MQINYEAPPSQVSHLIVDAESLVYRAYYAFTRDNYIKRTSKGYYNGCFWAFFGWLAKRYQYYQPKEMVICWGDQRRNLKRKEIFPSYKYMRSSKLLPAFFEQVRDIQIALNQLGFKQYLTSGYEADDIIATLSRKFQKFSEEKIIILSNDKDLLQLVNERVMCVQIVKGNTGKDKEYDEKKAEEKFGIKPSLISDYLTLLGDASDDVPPIPSIGPKTASMLLIKFGAIAEWFDSIDALDIGKALKQALTDNRKQLIINKKLVCLSLGDVPIGFLTIPEDTITVEQLFDTYEVYDVRPHHFLFFD